MFFRSSSTRFLSLLPSHGRLRNLPETSVLISSRRNLCATDKQSSNLDDILIITNSCAKRINDLKALANEPALKLRVLVEGGGCSGFQYNFQMEKLKEEEDLVFAKNNAEVIVDPASFDLIRGSTVDYQQELIRSAFAVTNNPHSESACGCGSSFAVKAFSQNPAID